MEHRSSMVGQVSSMSGPVGGEGVQCTQTVMEDTLSPSSLTTRRLC